MTETKREIPKAYDPSKTEDKWYTSWLDNKPCSITSRIDWSSKSIICY